MEVKKIVEGMTAPEVAQVIDDNFKAQNKILEDDIKKQNDAIGVSEYKAFSESESVAVGEVRWKDGVLYECVEATTGEWNENKWKATSFKKETELKLADLASEVGALEPIDESSFFMEFGRGIDGSNGKPYVVDIKAISMNIYSFFNIKLNPYYSYINGVFKYYSDGTFVQDISMRGETEYSHEKGDESFVIIEFYLKNDPTSKEQVVNSFIGGLISKLESELNESINYITGVVGYKPLSLQLNKGINGSTGEYYDSEGKAASERIGSSFYAEFDETYSYISSIFKYYSDGSFVEDKSARGFGVIDYRKGEEEYVIIVLGLRKSPDSVDVLVKTYRSGVIEEINDIKEDIANVNSRIGNTSVNIELGKGINGDNGMSYNANTKAISEKVYGSFIIATNFQYCELNYIYRYYSDGTFDRIESVKTKTEYAYSKGNEEYVIVEFYLRNSPTENDLLIISYKSGILSEIGNLTKPLAIDCWGDSLTQGLTNEGEYRNAVYPRILAETLGTKYNCYGNGGELSWEIAGRQGGCPMYIDEDIVIPSSGSVVVKLKSTYNDFEINARNTFLAQNNSGMNPCSIAGVIGELTHSGSNVLFTRSENGDSVEVKNGEIVYPRVGEDKNNNAQVIWVGQNANGDTPTNEELVGFIKRMVDYYNNKMYMIVTPIQRTDVNDVIAIEKLFKNEFGNRCLCLREYLNRYGIKKAIEFGFISDATEQDEIDVSNGIIPSSLRKDLVHLNYYGYYIMAKRLAELFRYNGMFK